ncbi:MAG: methyltransferase domain-containing protein [Acidimicrobiia bacterium]|nr:methyltransferase domain-containing protein [Acidimicrobiia bacterium]
MKRPAWLRKLRKRFSGTDANRSDMAPQDAWETSIDGEVRFWREYLRTKGERWPGSYDERTDPNLPLQPEIAELIVAPDGATVKLLDVGAGPLTFVGRTSPQWTLEVTAVDALGTQYGEILDEAGVVPPVRTQTCESEQLSTLLQPNTFDVVTARNTLDHSYDPALAIREMLVCAKPGGAALLIHHRNTGEDEQYHGMHQWNFEADGDSLIVWRPRTRIDVGESIKDLGRVERSWVDGAWESVVIRRAEE